MWITADHLGEPDNGVIIASYVASLLMAGALVAVTSFASALTKGQVIAFVFGAAACPPTLSGLDLVLNLFQRWAPQYVVDLVGLLLTHFNAIAQGIHLPAIVFFGDHASFLFITGGQRKQEDELDNMWDRLRRTNRATLMVAGTGLAVVLFFAAST